MSLRKPTVAVLLAGLLLVSCVGIGTAHDWQTKVTQGEMELGVSSTPEQPIAGQTAEFSGRIMDASYEGDANRTSWGGVTNKHIEVHVHGPDGLHDHVKVQIPEDGAHFHFSYLFPTDGQYTMTVVATIEGQEYAFEFTRNVTLMPAKATGEEMEHLSEEVHGVNEKVSTVQEDVQSTNEKVGSVEQSVQSTNEKVDATNSEVQALRKDVDELQGQIQELKAEQNASSGPNLGLNAALLVVGLIAGAGVAVVKDQI